MAGRVVVVAVHVTICDGCIVLAVAGLSVVVDMSMTNSRVVEEGADMPDTPSVVDGTAGVVVGIADVAAVSVVVGGACAGLDCVVS